MSDASEARAASLPGARQRCSGERLPATGYIGVLIDWVRAGLGSGGYARMALGVPRRHRASVTALDSGDVFLAIVFR
ncbi:unnamed protein product [Cuscuta campestris]|uniref:Uncharacterized protein n=1 Tax=Cuscuta campestris TaxID=132261 RepID=A0A484NIJ4_9ASTE|nr:unnamed protein product [Cuscuta campestris]